jgi:hypothetical protein
LQIGAAPHPPFGHLLPARGEKGANDLVRLLDAERIDRVIAVDVLRRSDQRRFWVGLKERKG